jgi:squalene-hopene/tetraprenyl-beta-curcumene cyclase
MSKLSKFAFLAVVCTASAALPSQQAEKKYGTLFKGEVDAAIAALRAQAPDGARFGSGHARHIAMVLTAMGHCHRFYALSDGPVTRGAVKALYAERQGDGSFGTDPAESLAATWWALEALTVMDPVEHARDIEATRKWLAGRGAEGRSPWEHRVDAVLDATARGSSDPRALGAAAATALVTARGAGDWDGVVQGLVDLVACQAAARILDKGGAVTGSQQPWPESAQRGVDFLLTCQEDGTFFVDTPGGRFPDTGLSALGLAALQTKPAAQRTEKEKAVIEAGLAALLATQNDDGSFAERNANYSTCAVMLALAKAGRDEFRPALERAQRYILGIQNVEDRGYARSDRDYGSIGYGGDQRGDVSNLQFAVEALRASGLEQDHEAFAKALVFLQRSQNLRAVNDFSGRVRDEGEWIEVMPGDDGGSAYYPGNSPAGYVELPDGKKIPRSYGSMTYALLKTYTLAGVEGDDPRIRAAVRWIEANWTLDENPGTSPDLPEKDRYQGLYYYYMVLGQALSEAGIKTLRVPTGDGPDAEPLEVDWRAAVRAHLASLQGEDGSWVNERNGRWWEDGKALCTIYALLALERAR